jgi:acyl-CoA synthetase (AMP-forming)/AMP-acid ligase II
VSGSLAGRLSPEPILAAFEAVKGAMVDLDRSQSVGPDSLLRARDELTAGLVSAGMQPGDVCLMAVGNGPLFVTSLVSILAAGGSPLLLHADSPAAELARNAERYGARWVFTDTHTCDDLAPAGFAGRSLSCADWGPPVLARFAVEASGCLRDAVPLHPTSGTTGQPKLAVRPGAAAVAEARHYIDTIGIDARDTVLCAIPMSHAYGYGMCVMVPLLSGATVLSMRRFDARIAARAIAERSVTIYPSVPATLDLLLYEAGAELRPPRCITSAGAPLPERIATAVNERWGATVRPLYGTTETGGIAVARPDHDPKAAAGVGPAMSGVETRILDGSGDSGVGAGQLWISSASLMAGYLSSGTGSAGPQGERGTGSAEPPDFKSGIDESHVADGWFNTGDLARIDESGNINLRGRASEVINVFGNKVLPSEVEEVIGLLPEVVEVKVYAASNRWGSNSVKAAIVATEGLGAAAVKDHCRRHLVSYKQPQRIAMLERLPRSPAGKIVVSQLP